MKTQTYWLVWREGGHAPVHRHPSEASARIEAERLARCHRGQRFVVLSSVASVVISDVNWVELQSNSIEEDGIPF